ncbi:hypothetical protein Tco_0863635 [Tanacetum coccineum]
MINNGQAGRSTTVEVILAIEIRNCRRSTTVEEILAIEIRNGQRGVIPPDLDYKFDVSYMKFVALLVLLVNLVSKAKLDKGFTRSWIVLVVMSDPQKKAVYDQYGEEGLKGQICPPVGAGRFSFRGATGGGGEGSASMPPRKGAMIERTVFGA